MDVDTSDNEDVPDLAIFTADEILVKGLKLLGWTDKQIARPRGDTNLERYIGMYGMFPEAVAQLVEDLQTTKVKEARIPADKFNIDKLHWTIHWLYRYPTETEQSNTWNKCANTIRDACWFYVKKIKSLKEEKIVWPRHFKPSDIWIMTVDGTHLVTLEPGNKEVPKDSGLLLIQTPFSRFQL